MNILNIVDGNLENNLNNNISFKYKNNKLDLIIDDNSPICINIKSNKNNLTINIKIKKNIEKKVFLLSSTNNINIDINIDLEENSNLIFNWYSINKDTNKNVLVNLNGINSKIEYYYSCTGSVKKILTVNHNNKNTNSNVRTHGISNNDKQEFIITEKVPKNMKDSILTQASKIINLGDNNSTIKPILLIDENEVSASHSSVICNINEDDLLYLMSRGINKKNSINLLTTGFLVNNLKLEKEEKHLLFEKYIFRR